MAVCMDGEYIHAFLLSLFFILATLRSLGFVQMQNKIKNTQNFFNIAQTRTEWRLQMIRSVILNQCCTNKSEWMVNGKSVES